MLRLVSFLLLLCCPLLPMAQSINGIVADASSGKPIGDVAIENIYTKAGLLTDSSGHFNMPVAAGQLVEFHRIGYKIARVRVGASVAPYYRIFMEQGAQELQEVEVRDHFQDFKHDSLRYHELFKKQIDYPVVTGWRAIQSPFTALGKTNQQMIHFQKEYAWLEQQKYVDYTFNERLIAQLTGLKDDSARAYISRYRPSYEMLRGMAEYDFFSYVKQTVEMWRQRQRLGPGGSRGGSGGG